MDTQPISAPDTAEVIFRHFPHLTEHQRHQFELMGSLYPQWNEKINVISRRDIGNLYTNHILHSLAIAEFVTPTDDSMILDLGTGGGFPGIPLAVVWPQCRFLLIDRIGKKVKVAQAVADALGLTNVETRHCDIGEVKENVDFVVSRAVMPMADLVKLVRKNISPRQRNAYPNGIIALKGGELAEEMRRTPGEPIVENISTWFSEPYFATKKLVYVPVKPIK